MYRNIVAAVLLSFAFAAAAFAADGKAQRVAFHVDQNDQEVMNHETTSPRPRWGSAKVMPLRGTGSSRGAVSCGAFDGTAGAGF
jgi:hypothetical protein